MVDAESRIGAGLDNGKLGNAADATGKLLAVWRAGRCAARKSGTASNTRGSGVAEFPKLDSVTAAGAALASVMVPAVRSFGERLVCELGAEGAWCMGVFNFLIASWRNVTAGAHIGRSSQVIGSCRAGLERLPDVDDCANWEDCRPFG